MPRIRSRTQDSEIIVLNEVNKSSDEDLIVGCKFGRMSNTPNPDRTGPGYGTFVGSKTFDANKGDRFVRHEKFEINLCLRFFEKFKIGVIGMYRSPSMNNLECDLFYKALDKFISEHRDSVDILLVMGDDNSHNDATSSSKARRAYSKLEEVRKKYDGHHVILTKTRKNHQTDHVIAFYDMFHYKIVGITAPGVADHDEMTVIVSSETIKPEKQAWKNVDVMVSEGDPEEVAWALEFFLRNLNQSYVETFEPGHGGRPFGPCQSDLDMLLQMFRNGIQKARDLCKVTVKKNMPVNVDASTLGSKEQRHAQFLKNKMIRYQEKLLKDPSDANKQKLDEFRASYDQAYEEAAKVAVIKDMQHMHKFQRHDTRRFFEATGKQLKSDQLQVSLSDQEVKEKLEKAEDNYKLQGPQLEPEDWNHIVPDRHFKVPHSIKDVEEAINSAKKIDSFYKRYAKQIAPAFSAIMYLVSKYFLIPTECKITKLTFLKSRTIFSCSFETRILETLVIQGLDAVMPPDDTGQMAYQSGRSTGLCVAIGLNEAEKLDDLGLQWSADQKKAFDSARWAPICRVFQKQAGAGEFMHQYFTGRNYRFRDKLGFSRFPMGRGTPPGVLLAPKQFKAFQSTDESMSIHNAVWICPGNFSDDKMPLTRWISVLNGQVQAALDQTWRWSQENHVSYHLTGDKAPEYYVLRKSTDKSSTDIGSEGLVLGSTKIERAYEACQLGISIRYFKDDEPTNEYGYKLIWQSKKSPFSRLAYRFQDIRNWWDPEMRWKCVDSYMIGKLSYGSALYWLRADPKQIDEVRYYYCMSMASVAGLETPEAVTLRSCKKGSVTVKNAGFQKLCKFLNMPTLKDMAIMDARVLIRHWKGYRPEDFKLGEKSEILGVNQAPGTLLSELYDLAKQYTNDWYPVYKEYCRKRKSRNSTATIDQEDKPLWRQYWEAATSLTSDHALRERVYKLACRDYFEVAEPYARVKKQLDPPTLIPSIRRDTSEADKQAEEPQIPSTKRPRIAVERRDKRRREVALPNPVQIIEAPVSSLNCNIGHPPVRGRKNRTCRICGYVIRQTSKQKKSKINPAAKFECCSKEAHVECWQNARNSVESRLACSEVKHWLAPDRLTARVVKMTSDDTDRSTIPCRECDFCHDLIEISDANRNHLFEHCGESHGISHCDDENVNSKEPAAKRRKGAAVVVGRYYELIRRQMDPGCRTGKECRRDWVTGPAVSPDIDRGGIAEIGVT